MKSNASPFQPGMINSGICYDASLSTMWGVSNCASLEEMFIAAKEIGLTSVELNHMLDSSMINSVDLTGFPVSSIHEPCPSDISTNVLRDNDWLVSSPDEYCRQKGVQSVKQSIDLAHRLNVRTIVMHCGQVQSGNDYEKKLRKLYKQGMMDSVEYHQLKIMMIQERSQLIGVYFSSLKKSLVELLDYARQYDVRIGLENRFHYLDIPNQNEMGELLNLGDESHLGFIYDVGHAQTLDRLGFLSHEMWLKRFSHRMFETHLHDVRGIDDHWPPGLGDVDFTMVAKYLPPTALRTCEIHGTHTAKKVQDSLQVLENAGCIMKMG